jgi:hypothetical protein
MGRGSEIRARLGPRSRRRRRRLFPLRDVRTLGARHGQQLGLGERFPVRRNRLSLRPLGMDEQLRLVLGTRLPVRARVGRLARTHGSLLIRGLGADAAVLRLVGWRRSVVLVGVALLLGVHAEPLPLLAVPVPLRGLRSRVRAHARGVHEKILACSACDDVVAANSGRARAGCVASPDAGARRREWRRWWRQLGTRDCANSRVDHVALPWPADRGPAARA